MGIKEIVREMIEQGSELETEDFEQIDFSYSKWNELDALVKENSSQDSDFKLKLDGKWDDANSKYLSADFEYIFKGQEGKFSIPI